MINCFLLLFFFAIYSFKCCDSGSDCFSKKEEKKKLIKSLNKENFYNFINQKNYTLLYFWAPWCSYCVDFSLLLESWSQEINLEIAKLNIDEAPELFDKFEGDCIPMLIVFREGLPIKKIIGSTDKEILLDLLKKLE